MKVFAIYTIRTPLTPELREQIMPKEVPATLKHYLEGKLEQFWFRENIGPIFLLNVASLDEAKATMDSFAAGSGKTRHVRADAGDPALAIGAADPGQVRRRSPTRLGRATTQASGLSSPVRNSTNRRKPLPCPICGSP